MIFKKKSMLSGKGILSKVKVYKNDICFCVNKVESGLGTDLGLKCSGSGSGSTKIRICHGMVYENRWVQRR
jgi:hypothetical protein